MPLATGAPDLVAATSSSSFSPTSHDNAQQRPNDTALRTPASPDLAVFGILHPAAAQGLPDARLGPHKDGRIRNPVPRKLKGKTDDRNGNFIVMHMELNNKGEADDKEAAAKRTSESTALAAKLAQKDGYVSIKRRKIAHPPDTPAAGGLASIAAELKDLPSPRRHPLTPEQTKQEQARLLTLLRSLHPLLVVDQICKALAFFGGIPGAPPPSDGAFPDSAESNGPGSLFIGWIAEIFPKVDDDDGPDAEVQMAFANGTSAPPQPEQPPQKQQEAQHQNQQQQLHAARFEQQPEQTQERPRRPRGRPKGSKTKVRRDRLSKMQPVQESSGQRPSASAPGDDAAEDAWIDINTSTLDSHLDRDQSTDVTGASAGDLAQLHVSPGNLPDQRLLVSPPIPTAQAISDPLPSARRRGRPKGSKNRPKVDSNVSITHGNPGATSDTIGARESTSFSGTSSLITPRPKPGRPRGSKNRPKPQPGETLCPSQTPTNEQPEGVVRQNHLAMDSSSIGFRTPLPRFTSSGTHADSTAPVDMLPTESVITNPTSGPKRKRTAKRADVSQNPLLNVLGPSPTSNNAQSITPGVKVGDQQTVLGGASGQEHPNDSPASPSISQAIPTATVTHGPQSNSQNARNQSGYFARAQSGGSRYSIHQPRFDSQHRQQLTSANEAAAGAIAEGRTTNTSPQFNSPTTSLQSNDTTAPVTFRGRSSLTKSSAQLYHHQQQNNHSRRGPSTPPTAEVGLAAHQHHGSPGSGAVNPSSTYTTPATHSSSTSSGPQSSFAAFPDPPFIDISNLDSTTGGMGIATPGSYTLNAGMHRTSNSAAYNMWRHSQG